MYWATSYTLAVTPVTPITYEGEFDNVEFLTTHENCFVEDVKSQQFYKDTDTDKWSGNATLTNFTDNSQIKVVPLYFKIKGSNGMKSLDDISISEKSGSIAENLTITAVKLYGYDDCDLISDFSSDIDDGELDSEYASPLPKGEYVLEMTIKSTDLPSNTSIDEADIYTISISGSSDGDVTDIEADIRVAQST